MASKLSERVNEETFHAVCWCVMGSSFSTRLSLWAERVQCIASLAFLSACSCLKPVCPVRLSPLTDSSQETSTNDQ